MRSRKIACTNCNKVFEFNGYYENKQWLDKCPNCGETVEIVVPIRNYLYPIGTRVKMPDGGLGVVEGYRTYNVTRFEEIVYLVTSEREYYGWFVDDEPFSSEKITQKEIVIEENPKQLVWNSAGGVDRNCHYGHGGGAYCCKCEDRTKCNANIFEKLCMYEDTGLQPEELVRLTAMKRKMAVHGLTSARAIEAIDTMNQLVSVLMEVAYEN